MPLPPSEYPAPSPQVLKILLRHHCGVLTQNPLLKGAFGLGAQIFQMPHPCNAQVARARHQQTLEGPELESEDPRRAGKEFKTNDHAPYVVGRCDTQRHTASWGLRCI